jgi:hypothetical protein
MDGATVKDAERRARKALVAQRQKQLTAEAACMRVCGQGASFSATDTVEGAACAEAEQSLNPLKVLEAAYLRACKSCASVERCEKELSRIGDTAGSTGSAVICP